MSENKDIEVRKFDRKVYSVEAIRVTSRNMGEVATWCGGQVKITSGFGSRVYNGTRPYIDIPKGSDAKPARAYIGNWITRIPGSFMFRVYKEASFLSSFQEAGPNG